MASTGRDSRVDTTVVLLLNPNPDYLLFVVQSVDEKDDDQQRSIQPNGIHHSDSGEEAAACADPLSSARDADC